MSEASTNQFDWPVRVYYEDTDGGGVVYHANYLKFMERARTEWLRSLGFEQTELRNEMGILFVVRALRLKYRLPAYFNDELLVTTKLNKAGYSLIEFAQAIQRNDGQHTAQLTQAVVEVVCVDAEQFKPVSMPLPIRNAIKIRNANNTMEPAWN